MPTYQNPNQFAQTPILGMPDLRSQPNSFFVTINPDSVFTDFQVGTVLKLIAGTGPSILVDVALPTEEAIGVIPYNLKKNTFAAGDTVQIFGVYDHGEEFSSPRGFTHPISPLCMTHAHARTPGIGSPALSGDEGAVQRWQWWHSILSLPARSGTVASLDDSRARVWFL